MTKKRNASRRAIWIVGCLVGPIAIYILMPPNGCRTAFDSDAWKAGGNWTRAGMAGDPELHAKLLGLTMDEVVELLGQPDQEWHGQKNGENMHRASYYVHPPFALWSWVLAVDLRDGVVVDSWYGD